MQLLGYTRYCICDTVPLCRVHVHMYIIYSPSGPGQTFIQFLRADNMFSVSMETTGYKIVIEQSLALWFVCNIIITSILPRAMYLVIMHIMLILYCIQTSGVDMQ